MDKINAHTDFWYQKTSLCGTSENAPHNGHHPKAAHAPAKDHESRGRLV